MSGPAPEGMRYFESADGITTLVPDDGRPEPCKWLRIESHHDPQACVECIRARATARRVALQQEDDGASWAPQSLAHAEAVPKPTVLWVGENYLLRRGQITLIHGAFGSGKTPLAYLAVVEQVKAGNCALIVDYEMGRSQAKEKLVELGLSLDQIDAGVLYVSQPPPLTEAGRRKLVEAVEKKGRDLSVVVIDSLTESMATVPGADDNNAQDVTAWGQELPGWLRDEFYAAVLVIDHSGVEDGPRPSGSHKKREFPQFHLWLRKDSAFSRAKPDAGRSSLLVMKDRSGDLPIKEVVATLRTDDQTFYLAPVKAPVPGEVELPLDLQPEGGTEEDVYADLLKAGTEGILKTPLCGSGSRGQYRRSALAVLISEGRASERSDEAGSRARRCWADIHAPE